MYERWSSGAKELVKNDRLLLAPGQVGQVGYGDEYTLEAHRRSLACGNIISSRAQYTGAWVHFVYMYIPGYYEFVCDYIKIIV